MKASELKTMLEELVTRQDLKPEGLDENGKPTPGKKVVTKCNLGLQIVAESFGYTKFLGLLANDILDLMLQSSDWKKVDGRAANAAANVGGWVVAAARGNPSGHVATVAPGGMVYSGAWAKDCPIVANVGKKNGFMGANWAFPKEPAYFLCMSRNG